MFSIISSKLSDFLNNWNVGSILTSGGNISSSLKFILEGEPFVGDNFRGNELNLRCEKSAIEFTCVYEPDIGRWTKIKGEAILLVKIKL